ncbi:MAG: hypothetical protein V4733_09670 [Verrucomicrobiota bacterium]
MKPRYWIPPIAAIAIVLAWNIWQHRELKRVEQENAALKVQTTATLKGRRAGSDQTSPPRMMEDWRDVAAKFAKAAESDGTEEDEASLQEMIAIQDRINDMSGSELAAALDDISKMDLSEEDKAALEETLIDPLIEKDPKLALDKFAERIKSDEDGVGWKLSDALANWARDDLKGATAWLDKQVAAGLFEAKALDGRNELLLDFEAAVVSGLLGANPEEAERRIAALPEDQRRDALERITFPELGASAQSTYAELIRGLVPADERPGSFVHVVDELVPEMGFDGVDKFFTQVSATDEEKTVAAEQAANAQIANLAAERAVTAADVDAMRAWLQKHSPAEVNEVTGHALAEAAQDGGEFDFTQASALAEEYFRKTGDDKVIIGFLESFSARSNLAEARPLAELIRDPARRQEVLDELE